jgi:hypothetical protein
MLRATLIVSLIVTIACITGWIWTEDVRWGYTATLPGLIFIGMLVSSPFWWED